MPRKKVTTKKASVSNTEKLKSILGGPDGDFVMKHIDKLTGYSENTFNPDPYKHAFNAGMRQVSVQLHDLLKADIEKLRENQKVRGPENA
ncbi:hypothetical protein KAR91_50785 [Candidatus Pacearchaeota archaeon]|nr:hypothetical protein [Candidatus Pacearchaeota archaeon]